MHQILLRLGLYPRRDPAGRAHSAPPDSVAGFNGPTSKRRGGKKGEEMKEKGDGGGKMGRGEGRGRVGKTEGKKRKDGREGEGRGDEGNEGREEGVGGEVKEGERRGHGKGSTFQNLRKNHPVIRWLGTGLFVLQIFRGARSMSGGKARIDPPWCPH